MTHLREGSPAVVAVPRSALRSLVAAAACAVTLSSAPDVAAQQKAFQLDRLPLAGAPDDGFAVWRPRMGERSRFYGDLTLGFSIRPLTIDDVTDSAELIRNVPHPVPLQTILYGVAGIELNDSVGFQALFPLILFQETNYIKLRTGAEEKTISAASTAPSDMRLDARWIFFRSSSKQLALGLQGAVWLPTGDARSYGGDDGVHGNVGVGADIDAKALQFAVNAGAAFRPERRLGLLVVQNEITFAVGAFLPLRDGKLRFGGQLFGQAGIGASENGGLPMEWLAEARLALDERKQGWASIGGGTTLTSAAGSADLRILAQIGYSFPIDDTDPGSPGKRFIADSVKAADTDKDGLPDDVDLCPNDPEDGKPPNTNDGCPALPDRDGDGIPDVSDKCPDNPEDFDKIDDQDGCPEDDADQDGVADATDACPKEPGDPSPEPAKNGCPQFIRRIKGSSEIQILKQVQFEFGKATIRPSSFPILDEVVRLLKVNPDIKHLQIEGHTDNVGADDLNQRLSEARARACMNYLTQKGIQGARLSYVGYGESKPRADNATTEGRALNRRTEFHIKNEKTVEAKQD